MYSSLYFVMDLLLAWKLRLLKEIVELDA